MPSKCPNQRPTKAARTTTTMKDQLTAMKIVANTSLTLFHVCDLHRQLHNYMSPLLKVGVDELSGEKSSRPPYLHSVRCC